MKETLLLIPPSEGKTPGGTGKPIRPTRSMEEMISRLDAYEGDWGRLLGVKGNALDAAVEANRTVRTAPTLPAIERYSGVVYDGIGYETLEKEARAWFDVHVRIVSALFGLLKPKDRIPNYKLKIEKLDAASFWKPLHEKALKHYDVIDLLPQSHRKAVSYPEGIAVDFVVEKNGKRVPVGHHGKMIKGRFVRWVCENQVTLPDAFSGFTEDGYHWTGELFLKR